MSNRISKVNELIKEEVSRIILTEFGEQKGIVTVTAVETTPDLHYAVVWYRYLNGEEAEIEDLFSNRGREIQHILNSRLSMKYVPKLIFRFDKSGEYVDKITELLRNADENKDRDSK